MSYTISMFVFFNLLMYIAGTKIKQYGVDLGKNTSLPCLIKNDPQRKVMWLYGDDDPTEVTDFDIFPNGSLAITNAQLNHSGIYTCLLQGVENLKISVKLVVRTTPPALQNVRVHPSTILALILWEVHGTGGYPLIHFTAQYKLADSNETWKPISPNHISPNCRQIDVYKLEPNTTYAFRVWARNHLGIGVVTEVEGTTLFSDQDKELERIFLTGLANFDPKVWLVAVAIVMGAFLVLSIGTCSLLYRECRESREEPLDDDVIELVPNIIVNPGFEAQQKENCNGEFREIMNQILNNKTVKY